MSADLPAPQLQLRQLGVDEHALAWGANCGPAALAGALGLQLADVRAAVSTGPTFKGHMTIGDMDADEVPIPEVGTRSLRQDMAMVLRAESHGALPPVLIARLAEQLALMLDARGRAASAESAPEQG